MFHAWMPVPFSGCGSSEMSGSAVPVTPASVRPRERVGEDPVPAAVADRAAPDAPAPGAAQPDRRETRAGGGAGETDAGAEDDVHDAPRDDTVEAEELARDPDVPRDDDRLARAGACDGGREGARARDVQRVLQARQPSTEARGRRGERGARRPRTGRRGCDRREDEERDRRGGEPET
jgi:hypothetical protein